MFGMGFFEILMVAVVAIIFLGPEKLPKALVDMAKFFRAVKKTMDDAKESLDKEINLNKIKEEALAYKNSITQGAQNLTKEFDLKALDLDDNLLNETQTSKNTEAKPQTNSNPKDSTPQEESQKAQPTNPNLKEIKLEANNKTTLSFGSNLNQDTHKES
ncbi:Sec-independent protein translocase subunit TatB [Helicobacter sp. MIT 11-5569]|uniref:Sec-independent protein translocase protein TatB n=1 Tax=Helicobacter sp. MIT 11-5569 TaxID=1548151 RepID=UPI00051F8A18|nr:Sec-independent protein translocase protein TatB [Helicobacter sp. MIT 11-5569]TLD84028.1 Sec-independent protein translocase subunit TatB [Helicobacter sp. MIT 11-5569]